MSPQFELEIQSLVSSKARQAKSHDLLQEFVNSIMNNVGLATFAQVAKPTDITAVSWLPHVRREGQVCGQMARPSSIWFNYWHTWQLSEKQPLNRSTDDIRVP